MRWVVNGDVIYVHNFSRKVLSGRDNVEDRNIEGEDNIKTSPV
jgi:hypothetical protein